MVAQHNGLVTCPKCGKTNLTPVGLCRHLADVHPVKVSAVAVDGRLSDPCPLGDGLSCNNCFFNQSGKCRFGTAVMMIERQVH